MSIFGKEHQFHLVRSPEEKPFYLVKSKRNIWCWMWRIGKWGAMFNIFLWAFSLTFGLALKIEFVGRVFVYLNYPTWYLLKVMLPDIFGPVSGIFILTISLIVTGFFYGMLIAAIVIGLKKLVARLKQER